ncbi:MAG: hypothetical protein ABI131_06895 [Nostocoides sp.]
MNTPTGQRAAAALLLVGAVAFGAADLLRRVVTGDATTSTAITRAVADRTGLWNVAAVLAVVAALALLPALSHLVSAAGSGSGARLTRIGGLLAAAGMVASAGHAAAFYGPYSAYAAAGTAASDITALDTATEGVPVLALLIVLFLLGLVVGQILLFIGLRRARRVPVWAVIAVVVEIVAGSTGGIVPGVVGLVAWVAAYLPVALALRGSRASDHLATAAIALKTSRA